MCKKYVCTLYFPVPFHGKRRLYDPNENVNNYEYDENAGVDNDYDDNLSSCLMMTMTRLGGGRTGLF